MKRVLWAMMPLVFVGCLFGSSKLISPEAEVGSVDGRAIYFSSLDSAVVSLDKKISADQPRDEIKNMALDSLISQKLTDIRVDSVKIALDNDWEFSQKRLNTKAEDAKKLLFTEEIASNVIVDSTGISAYYDKNKEGFKVYEQIHARHILVNRPIPDTSGIADKEKIAQAEIDSDLFAKDRAEAILKRVHDGENWDSLAANYSEDKSNADKGGDLGFFPRGRMVPAFDSAAFDAQPGAIIGPISTRFGYHIIKIEEYKPESYRPLDDEVKNQIMESMRREGEKELATAFLDSLKAAGVYTFNDEVINSDSTFSRNTWVMSVNSTDTLYFYRYVDGLKRYMKWKAVDSLSYDDKMDMMEYLKTDYLLLNAIRVMGYFDNADVVAAFDDYTTREATMQMGNELKDLEYEPEMDEIEAYFNNNIIDYTVERKLRVHHIIFEDPAFANIVRDSILAGADFVEMAKRYYPGEPEIREVAYNLDFIGPLDMGEDFYKTANALKVGEISLPVKTEWGYHIIKLVNRKDDRKLSQVRPGISNKLKNLRHQAKKARYISQWKAMAEIVVNEKLMEKYEPFPEGK